MFLTLHLKVFDVFFIPPYNICKICTYNEFFLVYNKCKKNKEQGRKILIRLSIFVLYLF